jgi:hypothetical protein
MMPSADMWIVQQIQYGSFTADPQPATFIEAIHEKSAFS